MNIWSCFTLRLFVHLSPVLSAWLEVALWGLCYSPFPDLLPALFLTRDEPGPSAYTCSATKLRSSWGDNDNRVSIHSRWWWQGCSGFGPDAVWAETPGWFGRWVCSEPTNWKLWKIHQGKNKKMEEHRNIWTYFHLKNPYCKSLGIWTALVLLIQRVGGCCAVLVLLIMAFGGGVPIILNLVLVLGVLSNCSLCSGIDRIISKVTYFFSPQGIGRKVMERQGWTEGLGLGSSNSGMTEALDNEGQNPKCKRGLG